VTAFAWARALDTVVVLVHGSASPSDEDWDAYLAFMKKERFDPEKLRTLVVSGGGRPTLEQRKRLSDIARGRPSRVAIVGDAASAAFVSAHLALDSLASRTFASTQLADALAFLELDGARRDAVIAVLPTLAAGVAGAVVDRALAALVTA
jgi:hypothetical protein